MKPLQIIGIPMDLGQKRRGVNMGPNAVRYAGISKQLRRLDYDVKDMGDVSILVRDNIPKHDLNSEIINTCERIYSKVSKAIDDYTIPICIGGDHSIAIGTVGGTTHHKNAGVIWIDAHGDFNTHATSPSGNVHGMPMAILTGHGNSEMINIGRTGAKIDASNVVLIGIRDLDAQEKRMVVNSGAHVYTMRDIDEKGISQIMSLTLKHLGHLDRIHVSLDLDAIDPTHAPGVGTPVPGGLTSREAHYIVETIAKTEKCCSMDIVEVNPIMDHMNQTAKLAVELTLSLFGKEICEHTERTELKVARLA
ncbi:arginase [Planctomycetota bacterium]|nr:arginase [Planctomycetota bacterium]